MYKPSTINTKLAIALSLAVLLVACKSTPIAPAKVEDKSTGSSQTGTNDGADTNGVKEVVIDSNANGGNSELRDPNNILSKRNIYFDYDSDAVKSEYRALIEAHAKYLLAHTDAKVILQGNTDERGTREYNLSLGQRRSVAVKKSFNLLGVQDKQIETVSYGEEKATPNCAGEACDKDRRVDIVHDGE
ncbi:MULTISPECIES: OmpA family protein [Methylotenera]|uniref:OmpA family protein n=1 Tax=Methylotenera TaxID=359407 RepID=UPI000361A3AA|nr:MULTISPECIES: OmpA family protein [Methylotenera]